MRKRLRKRLADVLPSEEASRVYSSFDIVGDIAIVKTPNASTAQAVAVQIMATHRSVKTVLSQTSAVAGDYRVRKLKLLLGENKTATKYKEFGCMFSVDVEKCYFSPRLSHERQRIANLVVDGETVVNMFSGVGCFSIVIAKAHPHTRVYSIDVNPTAIKFMRDNIRVNRVYGNVVPILGDSAEIIRAQLRGVADRVLMPLPEKALAYLPYAVSALKSTGGWIHYYDFQHATANEDPVEQTKQKVSQKLGELGVKYLFASSRVVRSTGPNWFQTVLDIRVTSQPSKF